MARAGEFPLIYFYYCYVTHPRLLYATQYNVWGHEGCALANLGDQASFFAIDGIKYIKHDS